MTRSSSPALSNRSRRDSHTSDVIDVENIDFQNTQKRVTRSQVTDSENSRDSFSSLVS